MQKSVKNEILYLHVFEFECQYDNKIRKHKHSYLNKDNIKGFQLGVDSHNRCFSDHTMITLKFIETVEKEL